jgi:hypothetical protein
MDFDIFLYLLFGLTLFIFGYNKDKLISNNYFIKCLLISISMIGVGFLYEYYNNNTQKSISFFGSQMPFIFLIVNKILRNIYFNIFKREPEYGRNPKYKIDYFFTLILFLSIITLPFIINDLIQNI